MLCEGNWNVYGMNVNMIILLLNMVRFLGFVVVIMFYKRRFGNVGYN